MWGFQMCISPRIRICSRCEKFKNRMLSPPCPATSGWELKKRILVTAISDRISQSNTRISQWDGPSHSNQLCNPSLNVMFLARWNFQTSHLFSRLFIRLILWPKLSKSTIGAGMSRGWKDSLGMKMWGGLESWLSRDRVIDSLRCAYDRGCHQVLVV